MHEAFGVMGQLEALVAQINVAAPAVHGGPEPGVAASGVRFQASARSHAVCTNRCTPLPDQLLAETLTQPP